MEIERKFMIKNMPDLSGIVPISYERYILEDNPDLQKRLQRKGNVFEVEIKEKIGIENDIAKYSKTRLPLTEKEFMQMKVGHEESAIIRDSYLLRSSDPEISIKVYKGRFDGLKRAEVEFDSVDKANGYIAEDWMGKEITETPLGMDAKLINLTDSEFSKLLKKFKAD